MTQRRFKAWLLPLCAACLLLAGWMVYHSLSGGQLAGCGAGSGCDAVMGSPWAWVLRGVPVSLPAAVVYALLIVCLLFLDDGPSPSSAGRAGDSLNPLILRLMALFAGCIVGAALWFGWLQAGVLHAFCPYCTLLHVLGCVTAAVILVARPAPGGKPEPSGFSGSGWPWALAGLAAAAVFAFVQTKTLPDAAYDSGRTGADLPAFTGEELPVLSAPSSPEDAETLTLLFDFQCIHCRSLHRILPEVLKRDGGRFRILLCPVPLSSACNPYIPASGIDRFAGSCPLTRLALAVWFARPEAYAAYWDYLLGDGDVRARISPADAEKRARELLGDDFGSALADPRIEATLRKAEELFGRTSHSEKSGVPRLIRGQNWLVPEATGPEELLTLIREQL